METSAVTAKPTAAGSSEFRPGFRFYAAFGSLLIVTFAAAIDAVALSTALPVLSNASSYISISDRYCRSYLENSMALQ